MITHTIVVSYTAGSKVVQQNLSLSNENEDNVSLALAAETSNLDRTVDFTISQLQGVAIQCTGDVTVTPYQDSTAGTPIVLAAGAGLVWYADSGIACPIGGNGITAVTKIRLSSTAGGDFLLLTSIKLS